MHGKHFIMQVAVSGEWREVYQGDVRRVTETRTFQGIGKSTRVAKFRAAASAMSQMRQYIQGWTTSREKSLQLGWIGLKTTSRGVSTTKRSSRFFSQGIYPAKNILLMQKLSLRVSMQRLMAAEPGLWPTKRGGQVPVEWLRWAEDNMQRGVHGSVVLGILVENGFVPDKNPLLMQILEKIEEVE